MMLVWLYNLARYTTPSESAACYNTDIPLLHKNYTDFLLQYTFKQSFNIFFIDIHLQNLKKLK